MPGRELAAIRLNHEGGEVMAAGIAQGIVGHLLRCTRLRSGACSGGSRVHVCVRTAVCHGDIGEQKAAPEGTEDARSPTEVTGWASSWAQVRWAPQQIA